MSTPFRDETYTTLPDDVIALKLKDRASWPVLRLYIKLIEEEDPNRARRLRNRLYWIEGQPVERKVRTSVQKHAKRKLGVRVTRCLSYLRKAIVDSGKDAMKFGDAVAAIKHHYKTDDIAKKALRPVIQESERGLLIDQGGYIRLSIMGKRWTKEYRKKIEEGSNE